jgi:hypothetical protein
VFITAFIITALAALIMAARLPQTRRKRVEAGIQTSTWLSGAS